MSSFKPKDRNPRNKWFITYPQSGELSKEEFAAIFEENFPCKKYMLAQEKHKDGEPHLHMLVELEGKSNKTALLDWAKKNFAGEEKRIDFEGVRSWQASVDYLTKPGRYGAKGKEKMKSADDQDQEPLIKGIISSSAKKIDRKEKNHLFYTNLGLYCPDFMWCITCLKAVDENWE